MTRFLIVIIVILCAFSLSAESRSQNTDIKDASVLIRDLKKTTKKIETYKAKRDALKPFSEEWERKKKIHNDNPCVYDPNVNPHACDWYIDEKKALEDQGEKELAEYNMKKRHYDEMIGYARTHMGVVLATIRVNRIISGFNCQCQGKGEIDIEELATCYQVCWDNAVDPGRTIHMPGEK